MPGHQERRVWTHDPTIYAPPKYRRACRYEAHFPDRLADLSLSLPASILGVVADAEHAVRDLNELAHPGLVPLARLLLRTESIASSKVEGMHAGVRELARAEVRAEEGRRANPTAKEILANISAMEVAIRESTAVRQFQVRDIVAVHRRLMESSPNPQIAGRIRTEQNWIGGNDHNPCGADFVPPPPDLVEDLLADLCAAVNDDALPALVQAALVHAQFETIHPFADGNGRAGRALIHIVLRRRGLAPSYVPPISVVFSKARDRYITGLTGFRAPIESGGVTEWIEQFCAAAATSANLARAYLSAVESLKERWRDQLRSHADPRADAGAWALIDELPAHPVITGPVAAKAISRTKPATYQAIEQLIDAGVLLSASKSKRNQSWEAVGLLDLLAGLEAGRLPPKGVR